MCVWLLVCLTTVYPIYSKYSGDSSKFSFRGASVKINICQRVNKITNLYWLDIYLCSCITACFPNLGLIIISIVPKRKHKVIKKHQSYFGCLQNGGQSPPSHRWEIIFIVLIKIKKQLTKVTVLSWSQLSRKKEQERNSGPLDWSRYLPSHICTQKFTIKTRDVNRTDTNCTFQYQNSENVTAHDHFLLFINTQILIDI